MGRFALRGACHVYLAAGLTVLTVGSMFWLSWVYRWHMVTQQLLLVRIIRVAALGPRGPGRLFLLIQ